MASKVYSLVYHSVGALPLTPDDVAEIVRKSQARNKTINVTGLLAFHDNQFMQFLEGDQPVVTMLMESIANDPRHDNVQILNRNVCDSIQCQNWSMVKLPFVEMKNPDSSDGYDDEASRIAIRFPEKLSLENRSYFSAFLASGKEPITSERPLETLLKKQQNLKLDHCIWR